MKVLAGIAGVSALLVTWYLRERMAAGTLSLPDVGIGVVIGLIAAVLLRAVN